MFLKNNELTPVEKIGEYYFKRDDLFYFGEINGGKVRTALSLCNNAIGIVTAGSRLSPQCKIISYIGENLNIPVRLHMPQGKNTEIINYISNNKNSTIIKHFPAYNSVLINRARNDEYIINNNYKYIPFGMECIEAIIQTSYQVQNIPNNINRIIVPVGSGMTLCGILNGLKEYNINKKVIGIIVGANPIKRLEKYAPFYKDMNIELLFSEYKYDKKIFINYKDIILDPIYEAKCFSFLNPNDLFWIVGNRY